MLPWQFFSTAMTEASNSLILNANLISKVYFPRLIVPASSVITSFVDFAISFGVLVVLMAWYHYWPDWRVLMLPMFVALAFATSMGVGLWLCALAFSIATFSISSRSSFSSGLYVSGRLQQFHRAGTMASLFNESDSRRD
jgi:lipopolysaccharide transport system permease protein